MPNQFARPWTLEELVFLHGNIQKLTYKQKVKKHPVNSDFFKTWSAEMAYVLGFIAADGNICHGGKAHVLHIACDDKDIIEKIKYLLCYQGPIHQKLRNNGKTSFSLRICDPVLFYSLIELGITERKSLTLTPPIIPHHCIRHFIRGYFDGDGSVSIRNIIYPSRLVVDFYTASCNMADFLYETLKQVLGDIYQGKIRTAMAHQKTPYYHLRLGHKAAIKLFTYMYTDSNTYLEKKHQKLLEGMTI